MLIAVMSDSHDHLHNLQMALGVILERNIEAVIHCGDFVAPFVLRELDQAGIPIHAAFGNNDGDRYLLTKLSLTELSHVTLYDPIGKINFLGYKIAFTHYEEIGKALACTGEYDLVCYGHTHRSDHKKISRTYLLNPGEIMGKNGASTFFIVDTSSAGFERIELP